MINLKDTEISGYILAGGKSSRMGSDKGLIVFIQKTIVEHVIEQLKPTVKNIIIVSNNPEYKKFGFPLISDQIEDAGPAGGIHAALTHSSTKSNFIVSCDMPFITSSAINYLIGKSSSYQITVPIYKQKLEPLFGIYSKQCLSLWTQLIQNGTFKLQNLIDHFKALKLNVDDNLIFNDKLFTNLNTKDDLKNAK